MHIILPLTKSPHLTGRIGQIELQDWYRTLITSKKLLFRYKRAGITAKILVLTAVHIKNEKSEMELYLWALARLGVNDEDILTINEGYETTEQIELVKKIADEKKADLDIISTPFHFPRVWWLARKLNAKHIVVCGIPRPREVVTDIILDFGYPVVEMLGLKKWFKKYLLTRRISGKF